MPDPVARLNVRLRTMSKAEVCRQCGNIRPMFLWLVLKGKRPPSQKILDFLGMEKVERVYYRNKATPRAPRPIGKPSA